jgi:hypothetical protein
VRSRGLLPPGQVLESGQALALVFSSLGYGRGVEKAGKEVQS